MANVKIEKALYGPSWMEVGLGAVLGLLVGVATACVYLTFKPVKTVKEPPKDDSRVPGMVYYQPGRTDGASAGWQNKQKRFLAGGSVELNESELNAWAAVDLKGSAPKPAGPGAPPPAAAPAKAPADAAKAGEAPASGQFLSGQVVNFRLIGDRLQFGFTCHLDYFGLGTDVVVHAVGRLRNTSDGVRFAADEFYIGSCPLNKLAGAGLPLMSKLMSLHPVSDEMKQAWAKVTEAKIEGGQLKLSVP